MIERFVFYLVYYAAVAIKWTLRALWAAFILITVCGVVYVLYTGISESGLYEFVKVLGVFAVFFVMLLGVLHLYNWSVRVTNQVEQ